MTLAVQLRLDQEPETAFRRLCRRVSGKTGPGLTLDEIRDAAALARVLEEPKPDPEKVALLAGRLDLDPGSLP